jgi:hypothetical protein
MRIISSLTLITVLALVFGFPGQSQAQTQDGERVNPLTDLNNRDQNGLFGNDGLGGQTDFFDLIHRARLGSSRSDSEIKEGQQESLSKETQNFRERQRQLLEGSSSSSSTPLTP